MAVEGYDFDESANRLLAVIEDKLHGIAVQLGTLNEFCGWIKGVIEEERKKDHAAKKPDTTIP